MGRLIKIVSFVLFFNAVASSGFSQLRMPSPYFQDRINIEATRFALHDEKTASFEWASEWTQETARTYESNTAIFVWHFKDGTKAYTKQGDYIGDFGMRKAYLAMDNASGLVDINGNSVQPMTLMNYPLKIELWIGAADDAAGFTTETLVDTVCFESDTIEYGHEYNLTNCSGAVSR